MGFVDAVVNALSRRVGEVREQPLPNPVAWRRVWSAGTATFDLLNTEEAQEQGGVPSAMLEREGWPHEDGLALLDYLPVLPLVGELVDAATERLWTDEWRDAFYDALLTLPAASHLLPRTGLSASLRAGEDFRSMTFRVSDEDESTALRGQQLVCFGMRRRDGVTMGAIIGGEAAEQSVLELLGVDAGGAARAEVSHGYCPCPF